jgi:phage terminase small subunit|tara:strand:+ start:129 stop:656 length:528 start_codon:yes stop_codon:yes gene_type:complete
MKKDLVKKELTEMQKRFARNVVEYSGVLSNTECAERAGYDKESSYQRAYELLNPRICPHVVAYISRIKEDYQKKYEITKGNHIAMLAKIRDRAYEEKMYGVSGRMEELRGKVEGYYVEKQMSLHKTLLDDKTEEELEAEMKKITEDYKHILEEGGKDEIKAKQKSKEKVQDRRST